MGKIIDSSKSEQMSSLRSVILSFIFRQTSGSPEIGTNVRNETVLVGEWHFARFG